VRPPDQPGLAAEPLPLLGRQPGILPDALDGNPPLQPFIPGEEDLAHAAAPQPAFDAIDADPLGEARPLVFPLRLALHQTLSK
jgi:hypothetical protein